MNDEIMRGVHRTLGFFRAQTESAGMVTQRQDGGPFHTHWTQGMGLDALRPARIQITRQGLPKPCRIGHESARVNGVHDRLSDGAHYGCIERHTLLLVQDIGNSHAILPMTTVAGVPPCYSGRTHAERYASGAATAGSRSAAEAVSRRLHVVVRFCGYRLLHQLPL
jgi:hypothetical protein